jgi:hypothetical protein
MRLRTLAWVAAFAATLLAMLAVPAAGQVNEKAYEGYLLVGQFGEICTMCEAIVLCEAAAAPPAHAEIPLRQSFTLYHLHTRTFLSQIATIWEWFIANFDSGLVQGHMRPVTVYAVDNGSWAAPVESEIHVALEPPVLAVSDDHEIVRTDRRWRRSSTGETLGYCQRLPLWDSLATIKSQAEGGQ